MYNIGTSPNPQLLDELETKLVFPFSNVFSHYIEGIKNNLT